MATEMVSSMSGSWDQLSASAGDPSLMMDSSKLCDTDDYQSCSDSPRSSTPTPSASSSAGDVLRPNVDVGAAAAGCGELPSDSRCVQFVEPSSSSTMAVAVLGVAAAAARPPRLRLHSSCSRPSIADKLSQMNLSFAGCGFLSVYHVGVAACMRRYCPQLCNNRISGASAGALAATALICETSLSTIMSDMIRLTTTIQKHIGGPFNPFVNISELLRSSLQKSLPEDAHIRCTGRLHISVTRLQDGCNCILSQFESKQQLIEALLCTSFIPVFSGWRPPLFCGRRYMDGCYSNNLPTLDNRTITVSPFCGEADVCPRDSSLSMAVVNVANTLLELSMANFARLRMIVFPPSPEVLSDLANQGFNDGVRFLMRHDLLKCQVCVLTTEIVGRAYSSCGQLIQHQHCSQCSHRQQEAMLAQLPAAVHEPLHRNIDASRRLFRNWVLDFPGFRKLLVVGLPWTVPYRVLRAVYLRIVERLPAVGCMLDRLACEVIRALHVGFSGHLPEARHIRAKYKCRVNVTEYGEAAIGEHCDEMDDDVGCGTIVDDLCCSDGQLNSSISGDSCASSTCTSAQSSTFVPGIIRHYDREFHVDFTDRPCGTSVVRTSWDSERLESEIAAAVAEAGASGGVDILSSVSSGSDVASDRTSPPGSPTSVDAPPPPPSVLVADNEPEYCGGTASTTACAGGGGEMTERLVVPGDSFDREVVQMALEAQCQADCGVSWYYTDQRGNLRVKHLGAVMTPGSTPCGSRRASACDDLIMDRPAACSGANLLLPPGRLSLMPVQAGGSAAAAAESSPAASPVLLRRGSLEPPLSTPHVDGCGERRRASVDAALLIPRRGSTGLLASAALAYSPVDEDQREEAVGYDAGMGTIKEESNDYLPEY